MVYIHIPEALTEEEQMLMAKYSKLKKKKKQLQALKTKPEPEKPLIPKRPKDARDAREIAKKLIKSGNINIAKQESQVQFKRPKGQERKKLISEPPTYHPYSTPSIDDEGMPSSSLKSPNDKGDGPGRTIPALYQTFEKEKDPSDKKSNINKEKPKTGYTIFVQGKGVTEDSLKKHFNDYGNIVNVSMEIEKNRGFVTFSKTEATDRAIAEMHGRLINGNPLTVTLARKQPQIEQINNASSSAVWSTLATSHSQKGHHKDHREVVTYEDDIF